MERFPHTWACWESAKRTTRGRTRLTKILAAKKDLYVVDCHSHLQLKMPLNNCLLGANLFTLRPCVAVAGASGTCLLVSLLPLAIENLRAATTSSEQEDDHIFQRGVCGGVGVHPFLGVCKVLNRFSTHLTPKPPFKVRLQTTPSVHFGDIRRVGNQT